MPKFKLLKLVRDRIAENQIELGETPHLRALSPEEHRSELVRKIIEEAGELSAASSDGRVSEFADIQQVLDDLAVLYDVAPEAIAEAKKQKFEKKGGFLKGVFIEILEVPEGDKWAGYYRSDPERFPEVSE